MTQIYEYETVADMMLMDGNNHMRNSAYLDVATASRYRYLEESGYGQGRLSNEGFGAVIRWEKIEYKSEVRHCAPLRVELRLGGASPEVSRYRYYNTIYCGDDIAAIVVTEAGWFDLKLRRLIVPPDEMKKVILFLERTDDFEELRESVRK